MTYHEKSDEEIKEFIDESIEKLEDIAKDGCNVLIDLIVGTVKNKLVEYLKNNKIIFKDKDK